MGGIIYVNSQEVPNVQSYGDPSIDIFQLSSEMESHICYYLYIRLLDSSESPRRFPSDFPENYKP